MYSHEINELAILNFIKNNPSCNLTQIVLGTDLSEKLVKMYIEKLVILNKVANVADSYTLK
jgi:predicted transcriptional regulator